MTIRWKPRSENDGRLVILTDEPFALIGPDGSVVRGRNDGPSNGYRYTVRFPQPGSAYSGAVVRTRSGTFPVADGGRDYGGGRGPELARAQAGGGSQPSGLSPREQQIRAQALRLPPTQRRQFVESQLQADPSLAGQAQQMGAGQSNPLTGMATEYAVREGIKRLPERVRSLPGRVFGSGSGAATTSSGGGFVPGNMAASGNIGFKGPGVANYATGAGAGSGAIGAINAAAPVAIAGIAAHTLVKGLTGKSAEERFMPMFRQYMAGDPKSIQDQPIPKRAYNQAGTQYSSMVPSANNVIQGAAAASQAVRSISSA
jgi:hypothetical protein